MTVLLATLVVLAGAPGEDVQWHRVVGLLQYLQADYPRAVDTRDVDELAEQRGLAKEAAEGIALLGEPAAGYRARIESIQTRIDRGVDAKRVSLDCAQLAAAILEEQRLTRAPKTAPDLKQAAQLWTTQCALCHGAAGDAQTPVAATLTPRPASFHDPERMTALTPYRAFNTLGFGVKGTAMAAFGQLSEEERWALAFYVFTLRQPACDHAPPATTLDVLAGSTDTELGAALGAAEVPCLRQRFSKSDASLFGSARTRIGEARALYAAGKHAQARGAIVDAYLEGIEPVDEARLAWPGDLA